MGSRPRVLASLRTVRDVERRALHLSHDNMPSAASAARDRAACRNVAPPERFVIILQAAASTILGSKCQLMSARRPVNQPSVKSLPTPSGTSKAHAQHTQAQPHTKQANGSPQSSLTRSTPQALAPNPGVGRRPTQSHGGTV